MKGIVQVGNLVSSEGFANPQRGRVYSTDSLSPCLDCMGGGGREVKIVEDVEKIIQTGHGFNRGGVHLISPTVTSSKFQDNNMILETSYRIRKLTPRECFRLMGVEDKDIDTIQASGVSNSQQYKMAGNSIVVDCLYHLFRKMFTETESEDRQLTLF